MSNTDTAFTTTSQATEALKDEGFHFVSAHPQGEVWSDHILTAFVSVGPDGSGFGGVYAFVGDMENHDAAEHHEITSRSDLAALIEAS